MKETAHDFRIWKYHQTLFLSAGDTREKSLKYECINLKLNVEI